MSKSAEHLFGNIVDVVCGLLYNGQYGELEKKLVSAYLCSRGIDSDLCDFVDDGIGPEKALIDYNKIVEVFRSKVPGYVKAKNFTAVAQNKDISFSDIVSCFISDVINGKDMKRESQGFVVREGGDKN